MRNQVGFWKKKSYDRKSYCALPEPVKNPSIGESFYCSEEEKTEILSSEITFKRE